MDSIIAVRVRLASGADRYFLTWGNLGANRCWPGDIERAVLKASVHFALAGAPVDARVCDTLQAASGERYLYECLVAMQQQMPAAARKKFTAWTDKMTAAVLRARSCTISACRKTRTASLRRRPARASGSTWSASDTRYTSRNRPRQAARPRYRAAIGGRLFTMTTTSRWTLGPRWSSLPGLAGDEATVVTNLPPRLHGFVTKEQPVHTKRIVLTAVISAALIVTG